MIWFAMVSWLLACGEPDCLSQDNGAGCDGIGDSGTWVGDDTGDGGTDVDTGGDTFDTGTSDTGGDTGADTSDTGGVDTGADTSDTAISDTGGADTGADTSDTADTGAGDTGSTLMDTVLQVSPRP